MDFKRSLNLLIFVSACLLAIPVGVSADDQEPMPPEYREQAEVVETLAPTATPMLVFKGDEGIPFPSPTEIVIKPPPSVTPGGDLSTPTPLPTPTPTPWQKPKRCEENETSFQESSTEGDPQKVWFDLLFLEEDLIPMDPDEVFGRDVTLHPYGPKTGEVGEINQQVFGVPCVPYRIRRTPRGHFYDRGRNALKNYYPNQAGRGKFHPWIEQKLFGSSASRGTGGYRKR
jgi:hypothetical protein